jgi:cytochrome c oxidase cbb3-type subunit III
MLGFLSKVDLSGDLVNILGILGFFVVCIATGYVVWVYAKQMTEKSDATAALVEENWDGIKEYKNDIPFGWFSIFFALNIWAAWYFLVGYPVNAYSQIGEYNEETKAHNAKFEAKYATADAATLKAMGESVYLANCAACHGQTGDGMNGKAANFANWGNAKGIANTVKNGSKGLNFPMGAMPAGLTDEANATKAAAYILDLSGAKKGDATVVTEGKAVFDASCASCHGADAKGNNDMAPNLSLYGTPKFAAEVVLPRGKKGMIGAMPNFNQAGTLNKVQYNAVATYINAEISSKN